MHNLNLLTLRGKDILPYIPELAALRMDVFKEYPYLYDGDINYEKRYLETYINCSHSIMVIALLRTKLVGASTAIPLEYEVNEFKNPFIKLGYNVKNIFYFGESVLLPEYRGRGVYRQFFNEREQEAKRYGSSISTFCAIERSIDDPRKPRDYQSLDCVWQHFGYKKKSNLNTYFTWKEIDDAEDSRHLMTFWIKYLDTL